jgi:DnaK suppressor protein
MGVAMINYSQYDVKNDLKDYRPDQDPLYMSPKMVAYFKKKLLKMRDGISQKIHTISSDFMGEPNREADHVDQGTNEELSYNIFMYQEHEFHLLNEIDEALRRIDEGRYGYCEETDEPIGVKRLEAAPQTRYCLSSQAEKENFHKRLHI